jgi:hypothetical protein
MTEFLRIRLRQFQLSAVVLDEVFLPELLHHTETGSLIQSLCAGVVLDDFQCHAATSQFSRTCINGLQEYAADTLTAAFAQYCEVVDVQQRSSGKRRETEEADRDAHDPFVLKRQQYDSTGLFTQSIGQRRLDFRREWATGNVRQTGVIIQHGKQASAMVGPT